MQQLHGTRKSCVGPIVKMIFATKECLFVFSCKLLFSLFLFANFHAEDDYYEPQGKGGQAHCNCFKSNIVIFSPNSAMTGDTFDTRHDDDVG